MVCPLPLARRRHPWLDAAIFSADALIGVESKQFEPFRDAKRPAFSAAYDRPVWGTSMDRYSAVRHRLTARTLVYFHLGAAQLVKHAYGLVTQAGREGRTAVLFYLFAEPAEREGKPIGATTLAAHREEVEDFARLVAGDAVMFAASSYRDWLSAWSGDTAAHADRLIARFVS